MSDLPITPPEKVSFRWALWRITVDRDIARKHALKEYTAIRDAGAIDPWIHDVGTVIALKKAQWDRDHGFISSGVLL